MMLRKIPSSSYSPVISQPTHRFENGPRQILGAPQTWKFSNAFQEPERNCRSSSAEWAKLLIDSCSLESYSLGLGLSGIGARGHLRR